MLNNILLKRNYGKKRKRLQVRGVKQHYLDIDQKFLQWFREHRDILQQSDDTIIIRQEKVSFKQLQRRKKQISIELNHMPLSSK